MQSLERGIETLEIDALALGQHHGGLGEPGDVLMNARHQNVGAGRDGMRRQLRVKSEMGAPGRIDRQRDAVRVRQFGMCGHIRDTTDVARFDEHHGLCVRVLLQRRRYPTDGHAGGQAGLLVDIRANPDRYQSGQNDAEEQ